MEHTATLRAAMDKQATAKSENSMHMLALTVAPQRGTKRGYGSAFGGTPVSAPSSSRKKLQGRSLLDKARREAREAIVLSKRNVETTARPQALPGRAAASQPVSGRSAPGISRPAPGTLRPALGTSQPAAGTSRPTPTASRQTMAASRPAPGTARTTPATGPGASVRGTATAARPAAAGSRPAPAGLGTARTTDRPASVGTSQAASSSTATSKPGQAGPRKTPAGLPSHIFASPRKART